jgi:hypothetical protein
VLSVFFHEIAQILQKSEKGAKENLSGREFLFALQFCLRAQMFHHW